MPLPAARGVRKVSELIAQEGRTFIVTEEDDTKMEWDEIPDGTLKINPKNGIMSVKLEGQTTWVPAGLKNDGMISIAKDMKLNIETFTITSVDNGDGTFSYTNTDGHNRTKPLYGPDKYPCFELELGSFLRHRNSVMIQVNDALSRSVANGGLLELDTKRVVLQEIHPVGTQITVEYLQRFDIGNPYPRFFIDTDAPPVAEYGDLWLDTDEKIL